MRDHVRDMIHRARQGTDAGRVRGKEEAGGFDALAADAVRMARLAAAVHTANAVRSLAQEAARTRNDRPREAVTSGERTR